jgi:hypothetical protein
MSSKRISGQPGGWRRDEIESLAGLRDRLMVPNALASAVSRIEAALANEASLSTDFAADRKTADLEEQLNNIAEAIANSGASNVLLSGCE